MTTNLQQVGDVPAQLAETKTALRNVLLRHLDAKQYDEVVLG